MRLIIKSYDYQALMIKVFEKIQDGWRQVKPARMKWFKWVVTLEKKDYERRQQKN